MSGFRHEIGDALYDLAIYDRNDGVLAEETVMHTIVKRTERFVYVREFPDRYGPIQPDGLVRFSVAELEAKGRAWNQAHLMGLHTRPAPGWPLLVLGCTPSELLAIEAAR